MNTKRSFFLIGVILALLGGFAQLGPQQTEAGKQGMLSVRHLYGPYWSTEEGRDTFLVFNNPSAEMTGCRVSLLGKEGDLLLEHEVQLSPLQSLSLSLSAVLAQPSSGHLRISFPATLGRLPVTSIIEQAGQLHPVALIDESELKTTDDLLEVLIPSFARGWQKTRLIISNPGTEPVRGDLWGEVDGERIQASFGLGGLGQRIFSFDHGSFASKGALTLTLRTRPGSSKLIAVAFSSTPQGVFAVEVGHRSSNA